MGLSWQMHDLIFTRDALSICRNGSCIELGSKAQYIEIVLAVQKIFP